MLQITILLKVYILFVDPKVLQGPQNIIIEDLSVEGTIYIAFDANDVTYTQYINISPNYNAAIIVFYLLPHIFFVKYLPWPPPILTMPIRPKKVEF